MKAEDLRDVQRVLWAAADDMRANSSLAPAEYRGPVRGQLTTELGNRVDLEPGASSWLSHPLATTRAVRARSYCPAWPSTLESASSHVTHRDAMTDTTTNVIGYVKFTAALIGLVQNDFRTL
jgi:hypothetical protein